MRQGYRRFCVGNDWRCQYNANRAQLQAGATLSQNSFPHGGPGNCFRGYLKQFQRSGIEGSIEILFQRKIKQGILLGHLRKKCHA
jgi:hypothetical protein